jgi:hypothetical protein
MRSNMPARQLLSDEDHIEEHDRTKMLLINWPTPATMLSRQYVPHAKMELAREDLRADKTYLFQKFNVDGTLLAGTIDAANHLFEAETLNSGKIKIRLYLDDNTGELWIEQPACRTFTNPDTRIDPLIVHSMGTSRTQGQEYQAQDNVSSSYLRPPQTTRERSANSAYR